MEETTLTVENLLMLIAKHYPEQVEDVRTLLQADAGVANVALSLLSLGFVTGRRYGFEEAQHALLQAEAPQGTP